MTYATIETVPVPRRVVQGLESSEVILSIIFQGQAVMPSAGNTCILARDPTKCGNREHSRRAMAPQNSRRAASFGSGMIPPKRNRQGRGLEGGDHSYESHTGGTYGIQPARSTRFPEIEGLLCKPARALSTSPKSFPTVRMRETAFCRDTAGALSIR